jgi:hypothetical protein
VRILREHVSLDDEYLAMVLWRINWKGDGRGGSRSMMRLCFLARLLHVFGFPVALLRHLQSTPRIGPQCNCRNCRRPSQIPITGRHT